MKKRELQHFVVLSDVPSHHLMSPSSHFIFLLLSLSVFSSFFRCRHLILSLHPDPPPRLSLSLQSVSSDSHAHTSSFWFSLSSASFITWHYVRNNQWKKSEHIFAEKSTSDSLMLSFYLFFWSSRIYKRYRIEWERCIKKSWWKWCAWRCLLFPSSIFSHPPHLVSWRVYFLSDTFLYLLMIIRWMKSRLRNFVRVKWEELFSILPTHRNDQHHPVSYPNDYTLGDLPLLLLFDLHLTLNAIFTIFDTSL